MRVSGAIMLRGMCQRMALRQDKQRSQKGF